MNQLREMVIHKDSCGAFEKQLNKLGFQFQKIKNLGFLIRIALSIIIHVRFGRILNYLIF